MKFSTLQSIFVTIIFSLFLLCPSIGLSQTQKTHLNVGVRQIVSLETFVVKNDNSLGNLFFYDRQSNSPFEIPKGYSFVVTDIIINPETVGVDENKFYLVRVEGPTAVRSFTARFKGTDTRHYTLTGGITYSAGNEPTARNTTFSSTDVSVQILGYFVRRKALNPGESRF